MKKKTFKYNENFGSISNLSIFVIIRYSIIIHNIIVVCNLYRINLIILTYNI